MVFTLVHIIHFGYQLIHLAYHSFKLHALLESIVSEDITYSTCGGIEYFVGVSVGLSGCICT